LGPNSVQNIARAAKISRPTTYEIIRQLETKGLFTETREKKKRYFVAQSPDKILGLLRIQKREIEEKEREFIRIIAALEAKYSQKEGVKIYKGKEGLEILKESFSFTPLSEIFVLSSKDDKEREKIYKKIKKRLGEIKVKEILTKKIKTKAPFIQRKFLANLNFKDTLILSDKIIFISKKKKKGFLIENPLMVDLMKELFRALWNLS
jgi:sugar-specific transcriptional regulator TrmB